MFKKSIIFAMILTLLMTFTVSCSKKENKPPISSEAVSSEITSSEQQLDPDKQAGWGSLDDTSSLLRPSFLSVAQNGDIFYCDDEGSIYKQVLENNGLSKVYSSSKYDFVSVECLSDSLICAGYVNSTQESGYIIFDLKQKTVTNAVWGDEFKGKSIYSLVHLNNSTYFLADPDRYGRYTLYRQTADKTQQLAKGVNEFFILRSRVFYNVGGYIFSINLDGSDIRMLTEVVTNDFVGFTIAKTALFYMSSDNTYHTQMHSSDYRKYSEQVKVYTGTEYKDYVFFCGVNGGIYAFSFMTNEFEKVSDYTAAEIICSGGYLYLMPADPADYPDVPEEYIIKNDIHRFKLSDLVEIEDEEQGDESESSDITSSAASSEATSDLISSSMAEQEVIPPAPEKFGK